MQQKKRKHKKTKKTFKGKTSATGLCAGPLTPHPQQPSTFHPTTSLRSPEVETGHRHTRRIASTFLERVSSGLIRAGRILKQCALLIDGYPNTRILCAAVRVGEAHIKLLARLQIPAQHIGDDERVVVLAIHQVRKKDVISAGGVVAAAGARPGGDGLIGAGPEARG